MSNLALRSANLFYGGGPVPVARDQHKPLPDFDLDADPIEIAFKTMAIISNASGGFTTCGAKLRINKESGFATLSGNGFSVSWGAQIKPRGERTIEEFCASIVAWEKASVTIAAPFTVSSDQYGGGWKRAVKVAIAA